MRRADGDIERAGSNVPVPQASEISPLEKILMLEKHGLHAHSLAIILYTLGTIGGDRMFRFGSVGGERISNK